MCVCACVFLCFPVSMETKLDTCINVHVYTRTKTHICVDMHLYQFNTVHLLAWSSKSMTSTHTDRGSTLTDIHQLSLEPSKWPTHSVEKNEWIEKPVDLHIHMHAVKHFESYSIVWCCPKVSDDSTKTDGFSRVCKCVYESDCVHVCCLKVFFTLIYLDKNFNSVHFNQIFTWPAIGGFVTLRFLFLFFYTSLPFSQLISLTFFFISTALSLLRQIKPRVGVN